MSESLKRPGHQEGKDSSSGGTHSDLERRVLDYFHRNLDAMDSLEGIARFWVREDPGIVQRCLADLHDRGLLEKHSIAGTEFYSLKKTEARVPRHRSATTAEIQPVGANSQLLVVDDDPSVRKLMVQTLRDEGYGVASAESGDRALEMFRADSFDLVVTDLLMPGLSGIDLLQAVKRINPSTEVIVVTAHASLETAIEALRFGAYDLLTKPLDDLELLPRGVARALEKRRLAAENRVLIDGLRERNLELKETVARLAAVNEIGKATTGLLNLNDLYQTLVRLVAQHLKARRVSVLVSDGESDTMTLAASIGITEEELQEGRLSLGDGIAGHVAASQSPLVVQDVEHSNLRSLRKGGRYVTASFMITPLTVSYPIRYLRRQVGVINVSDKHGGDPFTDQDLEFLSTIASQVAVAIENARLVKEMEGGYLGALVALIRAAEDAHSETRGHSIRVAEVVGTIAGAMDRSELRIEPLLQAAALHEVGQLSERPEKPDRKKGGSRDEWTPAAVMAAERILAPIASLHAAREIILRSADWFDAAPLPFGGDHHGTPIESRILATSEEYVRLTRNNGHDLDQARQAVERIRQRAGTKHDPHVVAVLSELVERGDLR